MKRLLTGLFCLLLSFTVGAANTTAPGGNQKDLYDLVDPTLQRRLNDVIQSVPAWRKLARRNNLAVGLVDLSGKRPRFASINGDHMMYAASLPKIAILLSAYRAFEDGSLEESPENHAHLTAMIRSSSNSSATHMIDAVGFEKIADTLSAPDLQLYDRKRGGGLWVGKRYASSGNRIGDPLHNISHGATATQVSRFFYLLNEGKLINPKRSKQMLEDLSEPGIKHKFVNSIFRLAPEARLYRKSGTWKRWHADSIMVKGVAWRDYILVAMVESTSGEKVIRSLLPAVEKILH